MAEEAFYERLREAFNDIFLLVAVTDNPEVTAYSYEHFEESRLWYQNYDLSHIEDEKGSGRTGLPVVPLFKPSTFIHNMPSLHI